MCDSHGMSWGIGVVVRLVKFGVSITSKILARRGYGCLDS